MNRAFALVLITITSLIDSSAARGDSANEVLSSCEMLLRDLVVQGDTVRFPRGGDHCWHYMTGMSVLGACAPPESTLVQIIRVFVDYARKNPARLHLRAANIATAALRQAFPCR
jgi:uncharacterized phosphosugar-binding protein